MGARAGYRGAQQHHSILGYSKEGLRDVAVSHPSPFGPPGRKAPMAGCNQVQDAAPGRAVLGGPPGGWQVAGLARPRCGLHSCLRELLSKALPSSSSEMQIPPGWGEYFCFSLRPNLAPVGARCLHAHFNNENRNNAIY